MDANSALGAMSALAQHTRIEAFRLLVENAPDGLSAGEVSRRLAVPHNTMSTHLATLVRSDLAEAERQGRTIVYRARSGTLRELVTYLVRECCGGRPELCVPLVAELRPCDEATSNAAKDHTHG